MEAAQRRLLREIVYAIETLARCYARSEQAAKQYRALLSRATGFMDSTRVEPFDEPFHRAVMPTTALGALPKAGPVERFQNRGQIPRLRAGLGRI